MAGKQHAGIPCGLAGDLMPLMHEGIASPESQQAVEEHLTGCPACQREWRQMQQQDAPGLSEALPLRQVSRAIRRQRRLWMALVACGVLALAVAFGAFATEKHYVPWQEGLLSVRQAGDELLVEALRPGLYPEVILQSAPDAPGVLMADISLYTLPFDGGGRSEASRQLSIPIPQGQQPSVWYAHPDMLNRWLYGQNPLSGGGALTLPRLALALYLKLALGLCLALALGLLVFRKRPRPRQALLMALGLPLSWLAGHFLVKRFSTLSWYSLGRDLCWIAACAAFLYLAYLAWLRLMGWLTGKKEIGIQ